MNIHEWCIAVLKGRTGNTRAFELYNLCVRHYAEKTFGSEGELVAALEPYGEYFVLEDFLYDYVTFTDDGNRDAPVLELAKEVLASHSNRYTLSVLRRKMNETGRLNTPLDDA